MANSITTKKEELWDNLTWLLERIIPVAEKANVRMGYHPNDPPISPYRSSAQIMVSADRRCRTPRRAFW